MVSSSPSRAQMSAEFAELVLDASPMVAIVREAEDDWGIIYASDAILQFGYRAEEVSETRRSFKDLIHPLDREAVVWALQMAIDSGAEHFTESYRLITAGGEARWVSDWTSISRDGRGKAQKTTTLLLDVTKQHESEESFEDISQSIPGALFQYRLFTNGFDRMEYFNQGCADIWELDLAQLNHDPSLLWDAIVDEDVSGMQASVMKSFQSLELWDHEYRIRVPSGHTKWLRARGKPRKLADDSVRWHTIIIDITTEKIAQEAMSNGLVQAIRTLAQVVEARDPQVAGHHHRVGLLADLIGQEMMLDDHRIEGLRLAAAVHDIGELVVPTELLQKPGPLTVTEFEQVKIHAEVGGALLEELSVQWPLDQMVRQHHERYDGQGYPAGLSGNDILLEARIIMVAEVVDAMSDTRPYRPAHPIDEVVAELKHNRGAAYDPDVVDAMLRLIDAGAAQEVLRSDR